MRCLRNARWMAQSPVADRRDPWYGNGLVRRTETAVFVAGLLTWGVGDLYTTSLALGVGAVESNPLARGVLVRYGFEALVAAKVGSVLCIVLHWRLLLLVVDWLQPVSGSGGEPVSVRAFCHLVELGYPVSLLAFGLVLTTNNALVYVQLAPGF